MYLKITIFSWSEFPKKLCVPSSHSAYKRFPTVNIYEKKIFIFYIKHRELSPAAGRSVFLI